jgi:hypothetical protein
MGKSKKALVIYLVVSSVILHVVVAFTIFNTASALRATNVGTVKDVSVLKDGDYSYIGYAVDYNGKALYVMSTREDLKSGDQVAVTITKYLYWPNKHLIITIRKNPT